MSGISILKLRIDGVAPLILHSSRGVSPFDAITREIKQITSKPAKQKTDADQRLIANLEWLSGLTTDPMEFGFSVVGEDVVPEPGIRIVLPSDYIEGVLRDGAKKFRAGKSFSAGVFVETDAVLCDGDGKPFPDAAKLASDRRFRLVKTVKVQASRIVRTRPMFTSWSVIAEISYLPEVVNERDIIAAAEKAGMFVGVGDHKPRFGRFVVTKV